MAGRPTKDAVEYFPHYVKQGKTMFIIEQRYGNDGYAFWFKLLELLASSEGHVYSCSNDSDWLFLQAITHLSEESITGILDTLANLGAIDKELWSEKIIWSDNLVKNLQPVYANRRREPPSKPISTRRNTSKAELLHVDTTARRNNNEISTVETPQSKVSKVSKESIDISDKPKTKTFTPPTVREVTAYCVERNNHVDPQKFCDFYESKGWMVGKTRMKDWKASVRTWEKNGDNSYNQKIEPIIKPDPIQEELEKPGTIFIDIEELMKEGGIDGLDGIGKQERKNW